MIHAPTWPIVLSNDDGIRAAGRTDACFYCRKKVGELHAEDCVTVTKLVKYQIIGCDGAGVGYYLHFDPYFWTISDGEFHKNDSSWCASNAASTARLIKGVQCDNEECLCAEWSFRFSNIEDAGPFITHPLYSWAQVRLDGKRGRCVECGRILKTTLIGVLIGDHDPNVYSKCSHCKNFDADLADR